MTNGSSARRARAGRVSLASHTTVKRVIYRLLLSRDLTRRNSTNPRIIPKRKRSANSARLRKPKPRRKRKRRKKPKKTTIQTTKQTMRMHIPLSQSPSGRTRHLLHPSLPLGVSTIARNVRSSSLWYAHQAFFSFPVPRAHKPQTKYTIAAKDDSGYLCHRCAKDSGANPFKKPAVPRKRKAPRNITVIEERRFPTLVSICIQVKIPLQIKFTQVSEVCSVDDWPSYRRC
jgi:hypothetical protein